MAVVRLGLIVLRTIVSESRIQIWICFGGRTVPDMTLGSFVLSRRQWIWTSVLFPVGAV